MRWPLRPAGVSWARPGPSPWRHGRVSWRASDIVIPAIAATLIAILVVHLIARLIVAPGMGQAVQRATGL